MVGLMEAHRPMYLWPDDVCSYGGPLNGYFWEPSPNNPMLYISTRRLERGEQQILPGGVVVEWRSLDEMTRSTPTTVPLYERGTALYRCYNATGELIYVGIAVNPDRRWNHHASRSPWWGEVTRRAVEWHDNRAKALTAEAAAIVDEHPKYNIAGKPA